MTTQLTPLDLTHLDARGDIAMVDVSGKAITQRTATAVGQVIFPSDSYQVIKSADGITKKGSITQTAHIAGVMASKRTHVKVTHKTGVEMEALTAVSVACLTIYDMTKALSHDITISDIKLLTKTGGKSDYANT